MFDMIWLILGWWDPLYQELEMTKPIVGSHIPISSNLKGLGRLWEKRVERSNIGLWFDLTIERWWIVSCGNKILHRVLLSPWSNHSGIFALPARRLFQVNEQPMNPISTSPDSSTSFQNWQWLPDVKGLPPTLSCSAIIALKSPRTRHGPSKDSPIVLNLTRRMVLIKGW